MSWATMASGGAVTLYVGYRWWRRRQRDQAIERELEQTNGDHQPLPDHLSPTLAAIAIDARRLRLELETPIRRIRQPLLSETPWARRQRCDEYDAALYEARRAMWDWLRSLRQLNDEDRLLLGEFGLSVKPFRALLFACDRTDDVWEQVMWPRAPDPDEVWAQLRRTILELERFEAALLRAHDSPYR
ncbi:hypothetical protein G6O69_32985 [Pseudenhygromyxa sp. WMMC2535]|uniref:hypothetical protein n=1 Tax=Pseudenhygromyxa sp. WMMC2535 TaxID=2712867 RepID=UPI001554963D|nr:hypothetical protein [Pseudenhygromyxa sp. WMMC2535]NVB42684.1 hypothetical protein [Pseudenhygromyxa sp. WMMC2535]